MHNAGRQAVCGLHLTFKTVSPGISYAAALANRVLEAPPADIHLQKNIAEQAPEKCTDGDMATLITTVQQILTGLQTADTDEDRFTLIRGAAYGVVMRK
jgi:hypothetical protein